MRHRPKKDVLREFVQRNVVKHRAESTRCQRYSRGSNGMYLGGVWGQRGSVSVELMWSSRRPTLWYVQVQSPPAMRELDRSV